MERLLELAKDYVFLNTLPTKAKQTIAKHLMVHHYKKGDKLIDNRGSCIGFSFILGGTLRVYRMSDEGREVTLYRLKKGDSCFLTILCVLSHLDNYAFAEVEEDAVLAIVPMEIFKEYILEDKEYLKYIFKNLYGKFDHTIATLEKITFDSIEKRVIDYLKQASQKAVGEVIIYTTHEKIAIDIGSSREVVSRVLKIFEKTGLLELGRGKIKIPETEKL